MKNKYILIILVLVLLLSCKKKANEPLSDYAAIQASDTLVVGTIYGSSSYFTFKDEDMGFDYELCARFAQEKNLNLKIVVAASEPELLDWVKNEKVQLAAYRITVKNELKSEVLYTNNSYKTYQVLVQNQSKKMISNVVELVGKEVWVLPGTKYEERLQNLNKEIGGGIIIKRAADSLTVDNLIEMVANGTIDYAVAENDVAMLNKTYYQNIDCKIALSFSQRSAWVVPKSYPVLQKTINEWLAVESKKGFYSQLYNKYFEQSKFFGERNIRVPRGAISPYDKSFKKYAKNIGWDWMLLASMCYSESKFDSTVVSWAGAKGVMQMMPRTAYHYGLTNENMSNPDANIAAATRYLKVLDRNFKNISDKEERLKFILAAYNAGDGHVVDAIALAEKYGKNPDLWYSNVESCLLLKSRKEYYQDPVVKHGYFRGQQTYRYVREVIARYEKYKHKNKNGK
jgi:membrane-bound lytic murein transglycosylase F